MSSSRRARAAPYFRGAPRWSIRWRISSGVITSTPTCLPRPGWPWLPLAATGGVCCAPYSDVDLLFLTDGPAPAAEAKDAIRAICQDLWDLRLKLSPTTRPLEDCDRLHRDNPEFNISLLDCRMLAGDYSLFRRLHDQVIPRSVLRDWQELVLLLAEVNEARHHQAGDTIFHLEPNIKDAPGGLRDYNVSCWLALLNGFSRTRDWTDPFDSFPASLRDRAQEAKDFLVSVRCFLHYRAGRDDNQLNWEAQQAAAEAHIGYDGGSCRRRRMDALLLPPGARPQPPVCHHDG